MITGVYGTFSLSLNALGKLFSVFSRSSSKSSVDCASGLSASEKVVLSGARKVILANFCFSLDLHHSVYSAKLLYAATLAGFAEYFASKIFLNSPAASFVFFLRCD
jgi:hypothetical protein